MKQKKQTPKPEPVKTVQKEIDPYRTEFDDLPCPCVLIKKDYIKNPKLKEARSIELSERDLRAIAHANKFFGILP